MTGQVNFVKRNKCGEGFVISVFPSLISFERLQWNEREGVVWYSEYKPRVKVGILKILIAMLL